MPIYLYQCERHGEVESIDRGDAVVCPECGSTAKRVWKLRIEAESARHKGRFDPVVGAYVENERQFNNLLREGQERESKDLGMDVKLATVDARRNSEGLAELHGWSADDRAGTSKERSASVMMRR